jgi:hypothetical protein
MDSVLRFLENFKPSNLGLGFWDCLIVIGAIVAIMLLANWVISRVWPERAPILRKIVSYTVMTVVYGFMLLVILNAIVTNDQETLLSMIIGGIVMNANRWFDTFFKRYDGFVDRKIAENNNRNS